MVAEVDLISASHQTGSELKFVSRVYFFTIPENENYSPWDIIKKAHLFYKNGEKPRIEVAARKDYTQLIKLINEHKDSDRLFAYPPKWDCTRYQTNDPRYKTVLKLLSGEREIFNLRKDTLTDNENKVEFYTIPMIIDRYANIAVNDFLLTIKEKIKENRIKYLLDELF